MTRSVTYGSFTIERTISAPKVNVFAAFADIHAKERWFGGPDGKPGDHHMDFRVGGHEHASGAFHDGVTHRFEATYYDIVPNERIVYAYEMYLDDNRISVSVATITFDDVGGKTRLMVHEDGTFLDGFDTLQSRKQGTQGLLEALATSLS